MPKICLDCDCVAHTSAYCLPQNFRTAKDYLWEKAAHTRPAVDVLQRFVRTYCCICCSYRRKKSIGIARTDTAAVVAAGVIKAEADNMCEPMDGIVTIKQNNNVSVDSAKQPLEASQILAYTEQTDIEQLICSGAEQQSNSTPVLSVPGISNEDCT